MSEPAPGERVEIIFADGAVAQLPPWPAQEELDERDEWIARQLERLKGLVSGG